MSHSSTFLSIVYKVLFVLIAMVVWIASTSSVQAQIPPGGLELDGYAWSSTVGWISLNCRSGGTGRSNICATSDYRVRVNADGSLSGYAWSSTGPNPVTGTSTGIGWIKFGGLGNNFPPGTVTFNGNARVRPGGTFTAASVNLQFEGWVRACAATVGGNCTSTLTEPSAGGWDGWISLSGTTGSTPAGSYGVGMTNGGNMLANSFAWGSTVVGWIDMNSSGSPGDGRVTWFDPNAVNSLTLSSCVVALSSPNCSQNLTWTTAVTSPSIQQLSPTAGVFSTLPAGVQSITMIPGNIYTFEIYSSGSQLSPRIQVSASASCPTNASYVGGICVCNTPTYMQSGSMCILDPGPPPPPPPPPPPVVSPLTNVTITASPSFVRRGGTTSIAVDFGRDLELTETCILTGGGLTHTFATGAGSESPPPVPSNPLFNQTRFTLTCTGPYPDFIISTNVETIASFIEI